VDKSRRTTTIEAAGKEHGKVVVWRRGHQSHQKVANARVKKNCAEGTGMLLKMGRGQREQKGGGRGAGRSMPKGGGGRFWGEGRD